MGIMKDYLDQEARKEQQSSLLSQSLENVVIQPLIYDKHKLYNDYKISDRRMKMSRFNILAELKHNTLSNKYEPFLKQKITSLAASKPIEQIYLISCLIKRVKYDLGLNERSSYKKITAKNVEAFYEIANRFLDFSLEHFESASELAEFCLYRTTPSYGPEFKHACELGPYQNYEQFLIAILDKFERKNTSTAPKRMIRK